MKKTICLILVITIFIVSTGFSNVYQSEAVYAESIGKVEENFRIMSTATIEDDFMNDRIVVVMTPTASRITGNFSVYNPKHLMYHEI